MMTFDETSMSSVARYTFVALLSTLITVNSKLSSEVLLGISLISMLLRLPYCLTELLVDARLTVFSCN